MKLPGMMGVSLGCGSSQGDGNVFRDAVSGDDSCRAAAEGQKEEQDSSQPPTVSSTLPQEVNIIPVRSQNLGAQILHNVSVGENNREPFQSTKQQVLMTEPNPGPIRTSDSVYVHSTDSLQTSSQYNHTNIPTKSFLSKESPDSNIGNPSY